MIVATGNGTARIRFSASPTMAQVDAAEASFGSDEVDFSSNEAVYGTTASSAAGSVDDENQPVVQVAAQAQQSREERYGISTHLPDLDHLFQFF